MNTHPFIPYGRQFISEEDIKSVVKILRSDFLTQGPKVNEFEEAFASYVHSKYAVAVSSGTAALHLSAIALGIRPGTNVITTPITFVSSANCVRYCGGNIYFADIDPLTYTLDPMMVVELLSKYPKGTFSGIIPVDLAGYPVDMEILHDIAKKYKLWVLEDACHAPGGHFIDSRGNIQYCGNGENSDLTIFSFHPVKHITTGEGGMITTNDFDLYRKLMILRTHGVTKDQKFLLENHGGWYYEMQELGYNYRLTDIQAALGISQLTTADEKLKRRTEIALHYDEAFKNSDIITPKVDKGVQHAYHLYIILVEDRLGLYNFLLKNGINSQVHYIPVYFHPYYQNLKQHKGDFPVAENYYKRCLSLPMYPSLTREQEGYVIKKVLEYVKK